jgi:hypothetical protein
MAGTLLKLFGPRLPRPGQYRLVVEGRVACPRSEVGDVDVDKCNGCPFLLDRDINWHELRELVLCDGFTRQSGILLGERWIPH